MGFSLATLSLLRQSLTSALAAAINSAGRFILVAILARTLAPDQLGQFVYASWLVETTFLICSLGVNASASRYIAEYSHDVDRQSAFIRGWLGWAVTLPALAGLGALLGARLSGITLQPTDKWLLVAWAISAGLWSMQTGCLIGRQRYSLILGANLLWSVVVVAAALIIPRGGKPLPILFGSMSAAAIMALLVGLRETITLLRQSLGRVDLLPWKRIRTYSLNVWITGVLGALVWSRGELPVVRARLGDTGVASYTVALAVLFGAMQGIMLWVSGVAPHLTTLWGRGQQTEALALARRLSDVQLLVSGCLAVVVACNAPEILSVLFGSAYRGSAPSLVILSIGLITLCTSAHNHLLQLGTDARFNRNLSIGGAILLFILALWFTRAFDVEGAALSRALTMWSLFLITAAATWRFWGMATFSGRNALQALLGVLVPVGIVSGGISQGLRLLVMLAAIAWMLLTLTDLNGNAIARTVLKTVWARVST